VGIVYRLLGGLDCRGRMHGGLFMGTEREMVMRREFSSISH
jgi:IMP dehydrogenase/GMP reductase